ncbi:MAG: DUF4342 domain-containing protein [Clostridiales bacterium]|nr:DUF4342 domain-containing protein [Clostridiales bacterium]MCF8021436.1 DUF4342 domain-containing protein [Clostridiales bacterium]
MHEYMEKIDVIKDRTGVSYKEAARALEETNNDVLQALIDLEEKECNGMCGAREDLVKRIRSIINKGQAKKIKVKKGERTVFEIPANMGIIGVIALLSSSELAVIGALGGVTAMAKNYTMEIEGEKDQKDNQDEEGFLSFGRKN